MSGWKWFMSVEPVTQCGKFCYACCLLWGCLQWLSVIKVSMELSPKSKDWYWLAENQASNFNWSELTWILEKFIVMEETMKTHSYHKISLLQPTVLFNCLPFPMQEYYFLLTCAYMPLRKRLIDLTEKMPALKIWLPWDTNCAIWCTDDISFVKMW